MRPSNEFPADASGLPEAQPPRRVRLEDGAEIDLRIGAVAKPLRNATVRMLAYNGSIPGPTLDVRQHSSVVVHAVNDGDLEATVHWHGLRLDNAFDGTTLTQPAIPVGGRFTYRLTFPDPGIYWYHPHIREDYGQEMGLYGAIVVHPDDPEYWPAAHREIVLTLDDVLIEDGRLAPFSRTTSTFTAMGRFGNVLLVNGQEHLELTVRRGEVVRFYLTCTANTRVFNIAWPGARMKLVGGDSGRTEREAFVDHAVIAPSERVVVDVCFDTPGTVPLVHRTPDRTYPLGTISVSAEPATPALSAQFATLRVNREMAQERIRLAADVDRPPDKTLALVAEMDMGASTTGDGAAAYVCPMHPEITSTRADRCPKCGMKLVPAQLLGVGGDDAHHHMSSGDHGAHDHGESHSEMSHSPVVPDGIEWEDDMLHVNRMTTPANMRWKLVDRATGAEGAAIDWRFRVGDRVKIRLVNETDSDHPMHHPFHIHGAGRFLVLARDGRTDDNLVWKDTVLVTRGETVDILLEVTNPGVWMAHCHIAEHHESGMMFSFRVEP